MTLLRSEYEFRLKSLCSPEWHKVLTKFDDANIRQTHAYGMTRWGERNLCHALLTKAGEPVAAAQVRMIGASRTCGIAYIGGGPMYQHAQYGPDATALDQMLLHLKSQLVSRRGLALRIVPNDSGSDSPFDGALARSGFEPSSGTTSTRIVNLTPPLEDIRMGLRPRWRTHLNRSLRNGLDVEVGTSLELFDEFAGIYREMHMDKQFTEHVSVEEFREIQSRLPDSNKLRIFICRQESQPVAGAVVSELGTTATGLFGATNRVGRSTLAAYFLHWHILSECKAHGYVSYDTYGVDKDQNPGGYQFKAGLAGKLSKDISLFGAYDCTRIGLSRVLLWGASRKHQLARLAREHSGDGNAKVPS